jgi:hypothetical protein
MHWQDFGDNEFVVFPGEVEQELIEAFQWLELMRECQEDRLYILGEPEYNPEEYNDVFD